MEKMRDKTYPCPGDGEAYGAFQDYRYTWWLAYGVRLPASTEPCALCGKRPTNRHHDDYNFPLRTRPLCRPHHRREHRAGNVIYRCP